MLSTYMDDHRFYLWFEGKSKQKQLFMPLANHVNLQCGICLRKASLKKKKKKKTGSFNF